MGLKKHTHQISSIQHETRKKQKGSAEKIEHMTRFKKHSRINNNQNKYKCNNS